LGYYKKGDIKAIFPGKWIFEEREYRITKMNEILNLILINNDGFGGLVIKKVSNIANLSY
jgi:hypothetical protein